ncbi:MAG: hypothetical protein DMD83_05695 [Candidatus Rokuibacteriota bacterium]|nr:MAG: hypothetical protein DMD83_05695 [Candidatus Rokubacteria bacterium]
MGPVADDVVFLEGQRELRRRARNGTRLRIVTAASASARASSTRGIDSSPPWSPPSPVARGMTKS